MLTEHRATLNKTRATVTFEERKDPFVLRVSIEVCGVASKSFPVNTSDNNGEFSKDIVVISHFLS